MKMTFEAEPHELVELFAGVTAVREDAHAAQRAPDFVESRPTVIAEQVTPELNRGVYIVDEVPLPEAAIEPAAVDRCEGKHRADPVEDRVRELVHGEMSHFLTDIERRLAQTREIERSMEGGSQAGITRQVHAEDLNIGVHMIDGYTVTSNSPGAGSIAWVGLHVVYNGVDYTATDGSTLLRYTYFIKPGSGTSVTLTSSDTKPTAAVLGVGGALLLVNNAGVPTSVLESSIPTVVADGTVDSGAIISGAVGTSQLGSNAVDSTKLANGAVVAGKIATGGVSAAGQFASGVVDTTALGANAVTTTKINAGAVDSNALGANAVVAGKVATGAISASTQIANGVVNTAQLAGNAVDSTILANGAVSTSAKIANGVVGTTQLAGNAVTSAILADGAVATSAKIATGVVGTTNLAANAVDSTKLADGAVSTSAKIATGVVGTVQLGVGVVTPVKFNTLNHMLY